MRVAVVCPYDLGVPGGVQDQTTRLVRWLRAEGHQATLVGPGVAGPEGSILLGRTTVVRINRSAAPISLAPRAVRLLREATADVDIVHVHEPLVPAVGLAAMKIGAAVKVATFHADPSPAVRGMYSAGRSLARIMLSRAIVLTAVSEIAASALRKVGRPVRIVPNGIDLEEYGAGEGVAGRVVFLGRDDPRKGLDILVEAWPRIVAAHPAATLHVVGAARGEAPPSVTYLGRLDEAEKRLALATASVMVAPNTGGESFGVSVLEGMASGCAVVASGIPAFAALLGEAGVLVAPGDAIGLADAVIGLLGDDRRRGALGAAARERAAGFDGRAIAARYRDVYHEALRAA